MIVGKTVVQTIKLKRVYECNHVWEKLNDTEDQCKKCGVIVTENGKKYLEGIKKRKCLLINI